MKKNNSDLSKDVNEYKKEKEPKYSPYLIQVNKEFKEFKFKDDEEKKILPCIQRIINECLEFEPSKRPTFEWITKTLNEIINNKEKCTISNILEKKELDLSDQENFIIIYEYREKLRLLNLQHKYSESIYIFEQNIGKNIKKFEDLVKYNKNKQLTLLTIFPHSCYAYFALSKYSELKIYSTLIIEYCRNFHLENSILAAGLVFRADTEAPGSSERIKLLKESLDLYKTLDMMDETTGLAYAHAASYEKLESIRIKMYNEAEEKIKKINENSIFLAVIYNYLYSAHKDKKEIAKYCNKAISIYNKCNAENEKIAGAYLNLGIASNGNEEQKKCYNEAIRIYKKCNVEIEDTARAYFKMGEASNSKEDKIKCYNETIRIYKKCNIENKDTAISIFISGIG